MRMLSARVQMREVGAVEVRGVVRVTAGLAGVMVAIAGCSTSKRLTSTSGSPTPAPASSTAPVVVSPSGPATPATVAPSPFVSTPTPSPGSPWPSSSIGGKYDSDAAVQAFYHYRDVEFRALNTLDMRYPALLPLETNKNQGYVDSVIQNFIAHHWHSVGYDLHYVIGVTKVSSVEEKLNACLGGSSSFLVDENGNVANNSRTPGYDSAVATMVLEGGRWKIDSLVKASFSCAGLPQ